MIFVELISGFAMAFYTSWQLTLILLSCIPFIALGAIMIGKCMDIVMLNSRKTFEKTGVLLKIHCITLRLLLLLLISI